MLEIYGLLSAQTIAYILLYFYLSHVFPGKCGTPKPFYFPLTPSYYCNGSKVNASAGETGSDAVIDVDSGTEVEVKIRGLSKTFKKFRERKNIAVNNLSLDIIKNQITVLLGHNGAGKTTTMSMISGIIPKTSGTISVDGEDNVDVYRHKIGYCPQHNVYMSYFTCLDHLWFFGRVCIRTGFAHFSSYQFSLVVFFFFFAVTRSDTETSSIRCQRHPEKIELDHQSQ